MIKRHEQQPEQIDEYSIPLGKLFKWLLYTIDLRAGDVLHRREHKNKLKEERKVAEEAFHERERIRNEALEHARNVSNTTFIAYFRITRPRRMRDWVRRRRPRAHRRRSAATSTRKTSCASGTPRTPKSKCPRPSSKTSITTTILSEMSDL